MFDTLSPALNASLARENPQAYGELLWQHLAQLNNGLLNTPPSLQIVSDDPKLQQLAWELLAHPQLGYLAHCSNLHIMRTLPKAVTAFKPVQNSIFQVLLFNTQVKQRLALEQEQQILQNLFTPHAARVRFVVNYDGRFSKFCELLQQQAWDLVIFSGHALASDTPCLLFESEHQAFEKVTLRQLQSLFKQVAVKCLILAACQSAQASALQPSLIQALAVNVPHVIGMRETVLDRASQRFVECFCVALLHGENIGAATQQARLAMRELLAQGEVWRDQYHRPCVPPDGMQWSFPVLYTDNPHTVLLEKCESVADSLSPVVFIGRRRELRALHAALTQHSVIILEGGAGMGKTALLAQLQRDLQSARQACFLLSSLQQISELAEIKEKVLCIIEAEHCLHEVNALVAALGTLHNSERSLIISTRCRQKIKFAYSCCYSLTAPCFEDFVSYGENLGLYYSRVQYRLLYQATGGNFNVFKFLQTQTLASDKTALLTQLAVARRYLQALQRVTY